MKSLFLSTIVTIMAFVGSIATAATTHPGHDHRCPGHHHHYDDSQVLARIQQLPSNNPTVLDHHHDFNPSYLGLTMDVLNDGRVFVHRRFSYKGETRLYTRQAFIFDAGSIYRYRNSISRLTAGRSLIVDGSYPIDPNSGFVQYAVRLAGHLETVEESSDQVGTRVRYNRSGLEVQVIAVLKDLLARYWDESFPQ